MGGTFFGRLASFSRSPRGWRLAALRVRERDSAPVQGLEEAAAADLLHRAGIAVLPGTSVKELRQGLMTVGATRLNDAPRVRANRAGDAAKVRQDVATVAPRARGRAGRADRDSTGMAKAEGTVMDRVREAGIVREAAAVDRARSGATASQVDRPVAAPARSRGGPRKRALGSRKPNDQREGATAKPSHPLLYSELWIRHEGDLRAPRLGRSPRSVIPGSAPRPASLRAFRT